MKKIILAVASVVLVGIGNLNAASTPTPVKKRVQAPRTAAGSSEHSTLWACSLTYKLTYGCPIS